MSRRVQGDADVLGEQHCGGPRVRLHSSNVQAKSVHERARTGVLVSFHSVGAIALHNLSS